MGLTSAFRAKARSATLVAASSLKILALSHERFNEILFRGPHHTEAVSCLLEYFASSVRRKNKEMAQLLKGRSFSALPKVAVFDSKEFTRTTFLNQEKDR